MHGAPWGTMDRWLRIEVDERAARYGGVNPGEREPSRLATATEFEDVQKAVFVREDVLVCA